MPAIGSGSPRPKPAIMYDFSQGYIAQNLPPKAVAAIRARGIGTKQLEAELRAYLRYKGIEAAPAYRTLQIVSRHVEVYPISFVEMERMLGRQHAREAMGFRVPWPPWQVQDFLDYLD